MSDEAVGAGALRRGVGDHVADAEVGDRDDVREDDGAAVVRTRHRAARDDVPLIAEEARQDHEGGQRETGDAECGRQSGYPPPRAPRLPAVVYS